MNKFQAEEWVSGRKVTDREYELLGEVVYGKVQYIDGVLHRQPKISAVPWPCLRADYDSIAKLHCLELIELKSQSCYDSTPVYRVTNDGMLYHSLRRALNSKATARL